MKFMAIPSPKSGAGKKCQMSLYCFHLGKLTYFNCADNLSHKLDIVAGRRKTLLDDYWEKQVFFVSDFL